MRNKYRQYLYCGVASATLVMASSGAFAQTIVNQSASNSSAVSNPLQGTNTITFGSGGLGTSLSAGASASVSATGAVTSTSVTGINSNFSNPFGGFGAVSQDPLNSGAILNNGSIFSGTGGTAASGSSLSIGAAGSVASFSVLGVGSINFTAVPLVGDIRQGTTVGQPSGANAGSVGNTGQITAPLLDLTGTGAAASVSAIGSQGSVSVGALGATSFTGTAFGNITQTIQNASAPGTVTNTVGGIWIGSLGGDGSSASATATGAAASISFSYVDTTAWTVSSVGNISQSASNAGPITNTAVTNGGIQLGNVNGVGDISGAGASIHAGATGSIAALTLSSVVSGGTGVSTWGTGMFPVVQTSTNSGEVSNTAMVSGGGLTGVGSSAAITATGAGAAISVASISDTSNPTLTVGNNIAQMVSHSLAPISNNGLLTLTGDFAAGATASVSAVGAQGAISVSAINDGTFNTPTFGGISQTINNGTVQGGGGSVTNTLLGAGQSPAVSVGNVTGNGASVSVAATGAVASVSYSYVNTTAWSATVNGAITQSVTNSGIVSNQASAGISVGNIGGVGASVAASSIGSLAAVSVTSINSGPPTPAPSPLVGYASPQILQTSINTAPVINSASIVSTGTVAGIGSSIGINATGAGASFSVASIADTGNAVTTFIPIITQAANNSGPAVQNTGSISLASGTMGAGSSAAISAVGASAAVSYFVVK